MPHIQVNLEETPDKFEVVPAGVYLCVVDDAEVMPTTTDPKKMKVKVTLRIDDGEMKGRILFDHIGLSGGKPVNLKQLCLATGVAFSSQGVATEDLMGKSCKVRVKSAPYKDRETGELKDGSQVAEYLFDKN